MFSAVSLRTPLTGMRCSRSAPKLAAAVAGDRRRQRLGRRRGAARRPLYVVPGDRAERTRPGQRGQVDAEVPGELAHRRLGQHRPAGRGRAVRTGATAAGRRAGGDRTPGQPDAGTGPCGRPAAGGGGRGRPALRGAALGRRGPRAVADQHGGAATRAPDRRSDPARPRPRPAPPRPRPATRPTGWAGPPARRGRRLRQRPGTRVGVDRDDRRADLDRGALRRGRSPAPAPAHFAGISTAALAVSTSTIGWFSSMVSPTLTSQARISPSVRPSPRSGRLNSLIRDIAAHQPKVRSTASSTRSRSGRYSSSTRAAG